MSARTVAVLYDDAAARASAAPDELGVLEAVDAVERALAELGHSPVRVPIGPRLREWIGALEAARADVVFNLCEGALGRSALEVHAAGVLELLGLPYTGSPPETLALARRKDRVNALLAERGAPVPAWAVARAEGPAPDWERYPAIVKPAAEDASVGVTAASMAGDAAGLRAALAAASGHGLLLVQEFVGGRELAVGIVGGQVLPISEIEFQADAGEWPLVTYDAKWRPGSAADRVTPPRCPAELDAEAGAEAVALARTAWRAVEGRGYGRVDLRADARGRLHVLEVNPNPDLAPSAGLARMAAAQGWSYAELIDRILREAV